MSMHDRQLCELPSHTREVAVEICVFTMTLTALQLGSCRYPEICRVA